MNYKNILIIFFFSFSACSTYNVVNKDIKPLKINGFQNKGFALIYDEKLFKNKIISKKMDNRGLVIFQKNLKKGTTVKIKNILNNKTIIAKVGNKTKYPIFNNSVISNRISKEIVENANKLSPAYLVFNNYELILKWNRSLRFALAVCTLKDKFSNEL